MATSTSIASRGDADSFQAMIEGLRNRYPEGSRLDVRLERAADRLEQAWERQYGGRPEPTQQPDKPAPEAKPQPQPTPEPTPEPTPQPEAKPQPKPTPMPEPAPSADVAVQNALIEINAIRTSNGLQPLAFETDLTKAARYHADDMAAKNYFSHTSADGTSFAARVKSFGYDGFTYGENIAKGYGNWSKAIDGWMNSPGHRANLLKANYNETGLGEDDRYYVHEFGGSNRDYVVGTAWNDADGDDRFDFGEGLGDARVRVTATDGDVTMIDVMDSGLFQAELGRGSYRVAMIEDGRVTAEGAIVVGPDNAFISLESGDGLFT